MPYNIQSIDYESMSTEQLEAILNCEFNMDEINVPLIQRINKILIEREPEKYSFDVDAARESFFNDYQNSEPLYMEEESTNQNKHPKPKDTKRARSKFELAKVACIAVITAALIFAGSMTTYAMGYDLWGDIAVWTSETFRFKSSNGSSQNSGEKEIPEVIQGFKEFAAESGLSSKNLPGWLPGGYSVVEMKNNSTNDCIKLLCALENKNSAHIILEYRIFYSDTAMTEHQKNWGSPEAYEHDGREYVILKNADTYYTVWLDGNIECSISELNSRDELIKVINSI